MKRACGFRGSSSTLNGIADGCSDLDIDTVRAFNSRASSSSILEGPLRRRTLLIIQLIAQPRQTTKTIPKTANQNTLDASSFVLSFNLSYRRLTPIPFKIYSVSISLLVSFMLFTNSSLNNYIFLVFPIAFFK